jgi:uncharacterized protein (TIGR00299 family) protein
MSAIKSKAFVLGQSMSTAYFDCFSGVAGDMIIGALLDAGLPISKLKNELSKLDLPGYNLSAKRVTKHHIAATQFSVNVRKNQPERSPDDIVKIISKSKLESDIKEKSIAIFNRLAQAEAHAHGEPLEKVHFHEVGAVDAIVDIVGAVIGLKLLGIDKVYSSPLALGRGSIQTSHGLFPVPAPATAELVKGCPVQITEIDSELTTPTGAAILTTLASFVDPGILTTIQTGYGAGSRDLEGLPNVLRVMISSEHSQIETDTITVLETNLDRISGENLGALFDELIRAGALDVYVIPIMMKKNRPGHLLSVLCESDKKDKLAKIIFRGGKTLGIRIETMSRIKLVRRESQVKTSGGNVSVKIAELDGQKLIFPERDDMVKAMGKSKLNYDDVYFEIQRAIKKE